MNSNIKSLQRITNPLNSCLTEIEFNDVHQKFIGLVLIAETLPRTKVIKSNSYYWRGICRSLIFRFPDDLEILKKSFTKNNQSKGIIQIRSASRFGQSDLGVNRNRINYLLNKLQNI